MSSIDLNLTVAETNLILEALGHLPFKHVYQLIGKIQHEASEQLQASQLDPSAVNHIPAD